MLLYVVMLVGAVVLTFTYETSIIGPLMVVMSMAIIGVHGMLSGTASMDFGGRKNVGVAVGIIDGFVYLGTAVMSLTYAMILPQEKFDAAGNLTGPVLDPAEWIGRYAGRVPLLHLKDMCMAPGREQRMAEVGEGNMNWPAILKAAEDGGAEYLLVEQDTCYDRDPFESLAISYRNLKAMGYR